MSKFVTAETIIKSAFPSVQSSDIQDAIDAADKVDRRIIGRVCGSYADKISQYLSIVNYYRATGLHTFDSLEIGVLFGGSCIIKLLAMKNMGVTGKIICIDPMTGYYGTVLDPLSGIPVNSEIFWANIRNFNFSDEDVELISRKSNDPYALAYVTDKKYATIMIDGDHTLEGVSYDWEHYSNRVLPDGFVLIDDFAEPSWPDITTFVETQIENLISNEWRDGGVLGSTYIIQKKSQCNEPLQPGNNCFPGMGNIPDVLKYELDQFTLWLNLADTYVKMGLIEKAEKLYKMVLKSDFAFSETHHYLSKIGLATIMINNNSDKVKGILAELHLEKLPKFANTIRTVINLGTLLCKTNNGQAAKSLYTESLIHLPLFNLDRFLVLQKIGEIGMLNGDFENASSYFKSSLLLPAIPSKERSVAIQSLCNCHIQIGSFEDGIDILKNNLNSLDFSTHEKVGMLMLLGNIETKRNEVEKAVECFSKILKLPSITPKEIGMAVQSLCNCFIKIGQFDKAQEIFNHHIDPSIEFESNEKVALIMLKGNIELKRGEVDKAGGCFKQVLEIPSITPKEIGMAVQSLCNCYMKIGQFDEAREIYNHHIDPSREFESNEKVALIMLKGNIELQRGEFNKAGDCFKEVLELPSITPKEIGMAVQSLCNCYIKLNQLDKAQEILNYHIDPSREFESNEKVALIMLKGNIELKRGEFNKAGDCFKEVLELPSITPKEIGMAVQSLCNCYIKLNHLEKAQEILDFNINSSIEYSSDELGGMHQLLGHIYSKHKEYTPAIDNYVRAMELLHEKHPLYIHCLLGTGYAMQAIKKFHEASMHFLRVLSVPKASGFNKIAVYVALRECYYNMGSIIEADKLKELINQK